MEPPAHRQPRARSSVTGLENELEESFPDHDMGHRDGARMGFRASGFPPTQEDKGKGTPSQDDEMTRDDLMENSRVPQGH